MVSKSIIKLSLLVIILLGVFLAGYQPALAGDDVPPGFPCKTAYTVKSGDTLTGIAEAFGTPALVIIKMNNLNRPELLFPGQTLCVKYFASAGTFVPIESGSSLDQIADDFDKDPDYLASVNGIEDPEAVYAGQIIFVPKNRKYFPI
jgi:LysM repeat protein